MLSGQLRISHCFLGFLQKLDRCHFRKFTHAILGEKLEARPHKNMNTANLTPIINDQENFLEFLLKCYKTWHKNCLQHGEAVGEETAKNLSKVVDLNVESRDDLLYFLLRSRMGNPILCSGMSSSSHVSPFEHNVMTWAHKFLTNA